MVKNYLKIAFRQLRGQKAYAVINITGLALGLACSIAVLLIVKREYAVNREFSDAENIFRVGGEWKDEGMGSSITTLTPVRPLLKQTFPEVVEANRSWGRFFLKDFFHTNTASSIVLNQAACAALANPVDSLRYE